MLIPTPHASRVIFLALTIFMASGIAATQDDPNRPPWAQKSKAKKNSSSSTTSSTSSSPAPPDGEPGKIVQPTPPPKEESSQPATQGNRIRVNVNLVTVLVSVLDEHNRPAPDLPREAF